MQYTVTVGLPSIPAGEVGEVVSRRLARSVNGGVFTDDNFGVVEPSRAYIFDENDVVVFRLYHIDDAGNISPPREQSYTVLDTTPPAQPGAMQFSQEPYVPPPAGMLLDDFAAARLNGDGGPLWDAYTGTNPNQSGQVTAGVFRLTYTGPDLATSGGPYLHFLPRGAGGYVHPATYVKSYLKSGTWDANANRLRLWVKPSVSVARRADGGSAFELGTYIRDPLSSDSGWQGRHFYHILDPNWYAGRWHLVEVNRVPQHEVGADGNINWPENPDPTGNYFDLLTRWYLDFSPNGAGPWDNSIIDLDDVTLATVTGEPDTLVSSICAVYTGTNYELTWAGPKNVSQVYDVAYRTSTMKVDGFASGTSGGQVTNPGSAYTGCLWQGPLMAEAADLYLAIRPVGQTAFTEIHLPQRA